MKSGSKFNNILTYIHIGQPRSIDNNDEEGESQGGSM